MLHNLDCSHPLSHSSLCQSFICLCVLRDPLDSSFALLFITGFCVLWLPGWFGKTGSWLITKTQQEIVEDISPLSPCFDGISCVNHIPSKTLHATEWTAVVPISS